MKNFATFDCETTILNNGNPWTKANKLCCVCIKDKEGSTVYKLAYDDEPYGEALAEIQRRLEAADLLIGFNIKFDLHWIRRYVPNLRIRSVYDCQLAEFLLRDQTTPLPSLDESLISHGLGIKLNVVNNEYWSKGIDTTSVPWDILSEYCAWDVGQTYKLFEIQKELLVGNKRKLFILQCKDLLGLLDAERNGLLYDFSKAAIKGEELQAELKAIDEELCSLAGIDWINFGSSDQLSALLYGGVIYERYREKTERTLKDGSIKVGERWGIRPITFEQLVKPVEGTESDETSKYSETELADVNRERRKSGKKELSRIYSTAAPVLSRLKAKGVGKRIILLLLVRAEKEKLDSTYYTGLIDKSKQMQWTGDEIHGQFNIVVAQTGRLSSSNPNLQNMAGDIKDLFYSRYE